MTDAEKDIVDELREDARQFNAIFPDRIALATRAADMLEAQAREREGLIALAIRLGSPKVWEVKFEDGHITYAQFNPGTGQSGDGVIVSTRCITKFEMRTTLTTGEPINE